MNNNPYLSSSSNVAHLIDDFDKELGSGAHGTVYSLKNDPSRAVKEISIDGRPLSAVESLKTELRILPLMNHRNIVKCYSVHEHEGCFYVEMVRYNASLDALLRQYRRKKAIPSQKFIFEVIKQLAAGLQYLHSADKVDCMGQKLSPIVHCDLRPANVLIDKANPEDDPDSLFVISDLGLCKDDFNTGPVTSVLSVYTAPEVLLGEAHTTKSDMWSLGTIIYELATGGNRPPFLTNRTPVDTYVEGWMPNLDAVPDPMIRAILKYLLVLAPDHRLTARELVDTLNTDGGAAGILTSLRFKALEQEIEELKSEVNRLKDLIPA